MFLRVGVVTPKNVSLFMTYIKDRSYDSSQNRVGPLMSSSFNASPLCGGTHVSS
jgi:hypothetical protein